MWHIYHVFGANVLILSMGQDEAKALLSKCRIIYNNLPDWMRLYTIKPDSSEAFGFDEKKSTIRAYPSTIDAGIGETASLVIHDEADFHDYFESNFSHTFATVSDLPKSKQVIVSTPNTTQSDSFFIGLFKDARNELNNFAARFYGCFSRPNRDEEWYGNVVKANQATPWVVGKNFPRTEEEALSPLSTQSCFNEEKLKSLWENVTEPETRQNYIHIFSPWRVGLQYAAGADVGEGVGLDYSVLSIIGKYGLQSEVAALIYTNVVGTAEFAYDCHKLCEEYKFPLLNVDNIGIGRAVIDKLLELAYPNLFYGTKDHKKAGWALSKPNKRVLVANLVTAIDDGSLVTRFKPQVKELMEYQWVKGYPEPTGKTHGDTVISLMLANEMLKRVGIVREPSMFVGGKKVW